MTTSLIMKHPNFTVSNLKNNIAVIRLPTALALGQVPNVQNICLPSKLTLYAALVFIYIIIDIKIKDFFFDICLLSKLF